MRQGVGNAISIMGARPTSNNFMIDGTANIDTSLGTPAAILSVDAIEEFKEQTKTYSAEYGFSANQINLVSKSGTNEFHGTGFDFIRNEALDARNFFDPPAPRSRSWTRSSSGRRRRSPFDGQNKTFFLVNYEGTRIERGFSSFYTVPTPEQLAGRFSTHDHRPAHRPALPEQHHPAVALLAPRAAGAPERLVPGARTPPRRRATTSWSARCPRTQDQFTVRLDQDLGQLGRVVRPLHEDDVRQPHQLEPARRSATASSSRTRRTGRSPTRWPIRSNVVNQFRVGRVEALADQSGIACPQADVDFLQLTGVFTDLPDVQRECPEHRHPGLSRARAAPSTPTRASNQPMWDISNTTTWVSRQPHAQFRRELPPLVAAARPGHRLPRRLRLQRRLHRKPGRGHAARVLLRRRPLPAGRIQRAGRSRATPASSTSCTSPRTSRTTGRSTPSSP